MQVFYLTVIASILLASCQRKELLQSIQSEPTIYSLTTELERLYDVSSLPHYEADASWQVSSYDTTGGNDDGFSGKYSFVRRNADSSLVIFDVKGAGVINRIWTPTPTQDTLDFYFDGQERPTLSIKYSDLFSGTRFPFVSPLCGNQIGGFFCYLPIPFSKGCRIVCRGKKLQFHQIQYRLYPEGSEVTSFDENLNTEERSALDEVMALWNNEGSVTRYLTENSRTVNEYKVIEISPGNSSTIFQFNKGGRILGIELGPSSAFEGLAKNIDIKITWDNEESPAVFSPVADFFGYAFGSPSMQSLLIGSRDDMNYCYFPMPFDKHAKIGIRYRNVKGVNEAISLTARVYYNDHQRDASKEGKFYAQWNKKIKSEKGKPHIFLKREGRGHYVGSVLQAQGLKAGMTYFFEGDDSTVIDGVLRMHGTGSEDYFNGGWYAMLDRWEGKVSLPLHGSLDYSIPFCRTGGYRLFLSDKISFQNGIHHSIEHGPTKNEFPVDYTSLGFYYSDTPPVNITAPALELSQVFLPDTLMIYPQLMKFTTSGSIDFRSAWKYNTGGESFTFTAADNAWLRISLDDIPHGNYSLYVDLIKKSDGCEFSLWQRQTQISPRISTYNTNELRENNLYVCDIGIQDFKESVTLRFKSTEKNNSFLLNRLILIKK